MDVKTLQDIPPWEWPKDAGKTFRKLLADRRANPSDRLIAADLAGDLTVMDDEMANVLLTVVQSSGEPEILRAHAAISFGPALEMAWTEFDEESEEFDDPDMVPITEEIFRKIQDSLHQVYSDASVPQLVRRRTLEASVRSLEPWHQDAVQDAYASGDRDWKLTAAFAMRYVRGFEKETLEALKSADPEIHLEAVVAAGKKELDAAWPHIIELVQDEGADKDLRIAAIEAAGIIRPQEAQGILIELADSDDEDIAEAADDALSMMGPAEDDDEDDEDEEDEDDFVN